MKTPADLSATVPQRKARGTKRSSKTDTLLGGSSLEDLSATEKLQLANVPEPFNSTSKNIARKSSRAEAQSDGEVSEAESTCSTLSGLQVPTMPRTTRRGQILLSSQSDSVQRSRSIKSVTTSRPISESQEEADISESESNCSSFSGIRMPGISGRTRSRQSTSRFPLTPAAESQTEEISDADSCCSAISGSQVNRVTRRRVAKSHGEASQEHQKPVPECPTLAKSKPDDVSDAESCCSNVSAGQAANRATRRRIAKSQLEGIQQTQNPNRESSPERQTPTMNKTEDVSDAESWCSGISAARTGRRLTRNSLARSKNGIESQPMVISKLGCVDKPSSDIEEVSFISSSVLCSPRSKPSSQCKSELQAKPEMELQSSILQHDTTTSSPKVTENKCATSMSRLSVGHSKEVDSPGLVSESSKGENTKLTAAHLDGLTSLPKNDKKGPSENQRTSLKKQSKTLVEPKQMIHLGNEKDDCAIIKVIDADSDVTDHLSVALKSCPKLKKIAENNIKPQKDDYLVMVIPSDDEIEILDTSSEDEEVICLEKSSQQKPSVAQSTEDSALSGNEMFIIDKAPGLSTNKKYYIEEERKTHDGETEDEELEEESSHAGTDNDFVDEDDNEEIIKKAKPGFVLSTTIDTGLNIKDIGGLYIGFDAEKQRATSSAVKVKEKKKNEEVLKRSIITPDFEQKESVPPYNESLQKLKKKRREERSKTTGDGWFGMKAPELTDELKNDLKALKMRSAIDPKRFYKKNDRDGFPKYFQVGTVVDSALDFYHSRVPKKQRKRTIVDELLADSEFRRYNKKKYQEIMTEKAALAAGKKNRKKKTFRT
ncbi:deoxynucleotidyltransferase terminal-interacting protein 2 isoform X2 [Ambystoma mexicanum]|uniref:deoxynucleotidyltransferase terminal-interacting protein 2 isoform X2 n=1 Tax=Ambystoma mexicanum TaxID=8296 RepID=UPI0037E9560D